MFGSPCLKSWMKRKTQLGLYAMSCLSTGSFIIAQLQYDWCDVVLHHFELNWVDWWIGCFVLTLSTQLRFYIYLWRLLTKYSARGNMMPEVIYYTLKTRVLRVQCRWVSTAALLAGKRCLSAQWSARKIVSAHIHHVPKKWYTRLISIT